jgi:tRNA(His) 5'-end guanylyltransferase
MWNNYFYQIQKKYSMRLSLKDPLVIRLDGKDVTKSKDLNLLYKFKGSFFDAFEESAKYFSKKYNCYSLFGTDEISFVIENPLQLFEDLDSDKTNHSNEVISLFSQYFFNYFNKTYNGDNIFFHAKCFSIPNGKINSYIKYRSKSITNVITTYFLKRNNIKMGKRKIQERIEECKKFKDYENIKNIEKGVLYFNGNKLDIDNFLLGKTEILEDNSNEIEFDIEF